MLAVRELERRDIPVINQWRQDRALISYLGAPYRLIGEEIDNAWFDAYLASRSNTVRMITYDTESHNLPLCLTSLTGIDWVHRSAELHIMIGDSLSRGKGIGTFSVSEMLRHAFNDLALHRVELGVLDTNKRAIHVYERCGFIVEGRKTDACFKNGQWIDMLMMAVLSDGWR